MQLLHADVCIVGAGPGGLATAHAVHVANPSLKVVAFEKCAADLMGTRRGAGLGLDINGQRALEAIQPALHRELLSMASFLRSNRVLRPDGSEVADVPLLAGIRERYAKQGYDTPCLCGWSDMQQLLAKALPPDVPIHTGMEFDRYETSPDGSTITAFFKPSGSRGSRASSSDTSPARDGSSGSYSRSGDSSDPAGGVAVQAKLLVAADGYFSAVRQQCLADGPPQWDGSLLWRARLPYSAAAAVGVDLVDSSLYVQDVGRFLFTYPISSGDLVWTAGCNDDKLSEMGLDPQAIQQQLSSGSLTSKAAAGGTSTSTQYSQLQAHATHGYSTQKAAVGEAAKARCLQAMAGVSEAVLRLIDVTPPSSLVEHGVFIRPVSSVSADSFGQGRVVVVGDAAHPIRPTGQGFNQAVEDAYGLGVALAGSGGDIDLTRLQEFREARARRIKPVVAFSTETGRASYIVLREARDEQEAAQMSAGWGTQEMSNSEYEEYLYEKDFPSLRSVCAAATAGARR